MILNVGVSFNGLQITKTIQYDVHKYKYIYLHQLVSPFQLISSITYIILLIDYYTAFTMDTEWIISIWNEQGVTEII